MSFYEQYKDEIMAFFKAFYELVVTLFAKLTGEGEETPEEA